MIEYLVTDKKWEPWPDLAKNRHIYHWTSHYFRSSIEEAVQAWHTPIGLHIGPAPAVYLKKPEKIWLYCTESKSFLWSIPYAQTEEPKSQGFASGTQEQEMA